MGLTQKLGTIPLAIFTDASNNIGIGGSPSGSYKFEVTGTGRFIGGKSQLTLDGGASAGTGLLFNTSLSGSDRRNWFIGTEENVAGDFVIKSSNAAGGNANSGTTRIAILSNGFIGIGNNNPGYRLEVTGIIAGKATGNGGRFETIDSTTGANLTLNAAFNSGEPAVQTQSNSPILFAPNNTERMRITSGGNVCIGTTTSSGYGNVNLDLNAGAGTSAYFVMKTNAGGVIAEYGLDGGAAYISTKTSHDLRFRTNDIGRMTLRSDGAIFLSAFTYGNTVSGGTRSLYIDNSYALGGISSIRASKKNIQEFNSDWIYNLKPVEFNYRKKDEDGNYTEEVYDEINYGLIAEDTAPIADFLINYNDKEDGTKEMVGIEYSRLITPLLKAIQELSAKVSALENKS